MNRRSYITTNSINTENIQYQQESDIKKVDVSVNIDSTSAYNTVLTWKSAKCFIDDDIDDISFKVSIKKMKEEEENLIFNRNLTFWDSTAEE